MPETVTGPLSPPPDSPEVVVVVPFDHAAYDARAERRRVFMSLDLWDGVTKDDGEI